MPDNDIVPGRVRKPWKGAAELVIGGHDETIVADECGRALAQDLREADCGRQILGLAEALESAIALGEPEAFACAVQDFRRAVRLAPVANAIVSEGRQLLELASLDGARVPQNVAMALLSGGLRRLTEASLFGPEDMMSQMHHRSGISIEQLDTYEDNVISAVQTRALSEAILRNPESKVRMPARQTRASTAEMIDEDVL
jgi:hypothetical protein